MTTLETLKQSLERTRPASIDVEVVETPAEEYPVPERTTIGSLLELILKRHRALDTLIRDETRQSELIPQLLTIAIAGFVMYGVMMGLTIGFSGYTPRLTRLATAITMGDSLIEFQASLSPVSPWRDGTAFRLIAAYAIGLIAATGLCLPSLYFYGLLSGIRLTMKDVVIHSLKSKATAAIALIGILPVYFVVCLTAMVFQLSEASICVVQWLGFAFPFVGGLWGTQSLYRGFLSLADTLPEWLDCDGRYRRSCFLGRLVAAWSVCYSVIAPIMVFTLWERMQ